MSECDETSCPPPKAWFDALERADADVAAGRTATWQDARVRLLATLEEIEAKRNLRRA